MQTPTAETTKRIYRMISPDGFVALFWEEIRAAEKNGLHLTQREAFNQINDEYFNATNVYRYASFECFKKIKDRTR